MSCHIQDTFSAVTSKPDYGAFRSKDPGQDLSGSLQGAGGVGGLLMAQLNNPATSNSATVFYCYDGNGNVISLVSASDGTIVAEYEYGPFGETLKSTGPAAADNHFRFSTKAQDETGLLYYGYRFYDSETGRWLSRDPIGSQGGLNEYGFVKNGPSDSADRLGLAVWFVAGNISQGQKDVLKNSYMHEHNKRTAGAIRFFNRLKIKTSTRYAFTFQWNNENGISKEDFFMRLEREKAFYEDASFLSLADDKAKLMTVVQKHTYGFDQTVYSHESIGGDPQRMPVVLYKNASEQLNAVEAMVEAVGKAAVGSIVHDTCFKAPDRSQYTTLRRKWAVERRKEDPKEVHYGFVLGNKPEKGDEKQPCGIYFDTIEYEATRHSDINKAPQDILIQIME